MQRRKVHGIEMGGMKGVKRHADENNGGYPYPNKREKGNYKAGRYQLLVGTIEWKQGYRPYPRIPDH
jgi:hypothetical protein